MDSESKISSAEQRAARRDLWETARAAYDRPRQSQSEAMRDARRSVWEQAKAAGIQNDETPPPVPTGKETGLNDDPRIARLEGIVRDLAGRLDDLEDDYPESEIGNGVGGGGGWDGTAVDFYGTNILTVDITDPEAILGKYIVYHTGLSPTKHPSATWPKNISKGPWAWDTEVRGSPWMSWEVGGDEVKDENGNSYSPKRYSLAKGKTCGTIRIPVPIPTAAYQVIQLGAGTGTSTDDNGVVANYVRAH